MWTDKWPTEPGWYWFYGWRFGRSKYDPNPELCTVQVFRVANGIAHVCNGHFFYKSEGAFGMFKPISLPTTLPILEEPSGKTSS